MMPGRHFRSSPGAGRVGSKDEPRPTAATLPPATWRPAMTLAPNALAPTGFGHLGRAVIARLEAVPLAVPELVLRLGVALAFWRSGNVKIASWDSTLQL